MTVLLLGTARTVLLLGTAQHNDDGVITRENCTVTMARRDGNDGTAGKLFFWNDEDG